RKDGALPCKGEGPILFHAPKSGGFRFHYRIHFYLCIHFPPLPIYPSSSLHSSDPICSFAIIFSFLPLSRPSFPFSSLPFLTLSLHPSKFGHFCACVDSANITTSPP